MNESNIPVSVLVKTYEECFKVDKKLVIILDFKNALKLFINKVKLLIF